MSVLRESPADRRRHQRQAASGPITLWWADYSPGKIQGRLVDISESGLRIAHGCTALGQGQQVHFHHAGGEGTARTIWTRIVGESVESGLLILPDRP